MDLLPDLLEVQQQFLRSISYSKGVEAVGSDK
jgi:hypothetical protein